MVNTSNLPPAVQLACSRMLLATPTPYYIYRFPAMKRILDRNSGGTTRMRRYNPLPASLAPLGNLGVTPPPTQPSIVDIDAKISFYGAYMYVNEQTVLQNQEDVLAALTMRQGDQLRKTEDQLIANALASSASFINATGGFNADSPTEISVSDVSKTASALRHANGETFTRMIPGEDKFGSGPVRNSYVALANDLIAQNLDGLVGFKHVSEYPSQEDILESEYGTILNMRFFLSSIGSTIPTSSLLGRDVFNITCVAREGYAVIDQDGYSSQFIYNDPSIAGGPLRLNASIGWKMATVPRITNDFWCLNLRVTLR